MQKVFGILAVLLFSSCAGSIPVRTSGDSVQLAADSLSYELVSPQGRRHYLVGTIHVRKEGDPALLGFLQEAFNKASVLCLEVNPADMTQSGNLVRALNQYAVLPPGGRLSDVLGTELHGELASKAASVGLDLRALARYQPWFASMTISIAAVTRLGFSTEYGLDSTLAAEARSKGKPIAGLETLDDQFGAFAGMSTEEQLEEVRSLVADWDKIGSEITRLRAAYESRDVASLLELLHLAAESSPETMQRLLGRRNPRMAAAIEKLAEEHVSLFIAIGAAHVIGKDSVPALLAQKGWTVRQVAW